MMIESKVLKGSCVMHWYVVPTYTGISGITNKVIPLCGGWEEMACGKVSQFDWSVHGAIARNTRCTTMAITFFLDLAADLSKSNSQLRGVVVVFSKLPRSKKRINMSLQQGDTSYASNSKLPANVRSPDRIQNPQPPHCTPFSTMAVMPSK